jgi:hypothetical protein
MPATRELPVRAPQPLAISIPELTRFRRPLISVFIVANVLAIVSWSVPYDCGAKRFFDGLFGPYLCCTGLWQGWDMFAPDPIQNRFRMDAVVTRRDGTSVVWKFPDLEKLGVFERYQKERYRKWGHDNVRIDSKRGLWEPTARYIARQVGGRHNPPVRVEMRRIWTPVLAPGEPVPPPAETHWKRFSFYNTPILAEDLR